MRCRRLWFGDGSRGKTECFVFADFDSCRSLNDDGHADCGAFRDVFFRVDFRTAESDADGAKPGSRGRGLLRGD